MVQPNKISTISQLIQPQINETTCGPTCLYTLYKYFGDDIAIEDVIGEVEMLWHGGTLGSMLANHALQRGYDAIIYTYNLTVFDPSWFGRESFFIKNKLSQQLEYKSSESLKATSEAYMSFLELGGKLLYEDLSQNLLKRYLNQAIPLICGLSATCLYRSMREYGPNMDYDDLRGVPMGHFVVLYGYDESTRTVLVADPIIDHPAGEGNVYKVGIDRVINAILLGIVTDDANLIVITPRAKKERLPSHEKYHRSGQPQKLGA